MTCAVLGAGVSTSGVAAFGAADAVVQVQVTDAAGRPLAGTRVLATVLWNSKADFKRHGRPRSRLLRTDASGNLLVPIKLDRQQRASVARNGDWVNLSIVALGATGEPVARVAMTRYVGPRAEVELRARSMAHAGIVRLVDRSGAARPSGADAVGGAPVAAAMTSCTYYWDADGYWNAYAQVGELHVDRDVPYAQFTYGRTADTTFDVTAKAGTLDWSIIGSVHVENSLASSVFANAGGQTNYHWALRTQFRFVKMKLFKDCLGGPYRAWVGSQEVHALEWTGNGMTLSNKLAQPARKAANTATYGPNTGWSRSSGSLARWSAAVAPWGVTLGAQSGASTNVKIEYEFGSRSAHYLYGDTGLPTVSKRVFQDTP